MDLIPYSKQTILQSDVDAVSSILTSTYLTQGPTVPIFEGKISEYCRANYARAFNSASSALHSACLALGLKQGDSVWTSAISFVATANCAIHCGANVKFIDIDPQTVNMSLADLEQKLENAERTGELPKIVIPVHFAGNPIDMNELGRLKAKFKFSIIEDASHALGAQQHLSPIGSCIHSDITIFSFHAVKIITSAEGGMALTNDQKLADRLELIRSHGITRNKNFMENKQHGDWYYEQMNLGFNFRMSDLHAALGCSQMDHLEDFVKQRESLAQYYSESIKNIEVYPLTIAPYNISARHLYVVRFSKKIDIHQFELIFNYMRSSGVLVNFHYIPIYKHPFFKKFHIDHSCPESENYYTNAISLPLFPKLSLHQIDFISSTLKKALDLCSQ